MGGIARIVRSRGSVDRLEQIGNRNRDLGAWAEAAESYAELLKIRPDNFAIWVQLGNCSKEAGRLTEAENAYKSAIGLNPRDADVWLQLGHLNKLRDRKVEALNCYESALALSPEHADIKHEIRSLVGDRFAGQGSAIGRLGAQAKSLPALLAVLRADPERADIFRKYFTEFVPS